ncbi:MAG: MBL fold metallo-hydrolase [Acidobacteria bacterium]|nr:MBL fold metallo-hydrolase [Acidobacteriota bacterium]
MTPELLDGGVWRIPLTMSFGPPYINVYLSPCPEGWMLIDAGMPTAQAFDELASALAEIGVEPSGLRHIVATHLHPDHCGLAPRLRDLSGAKIWMHRADADLLLKLKSTRESQEILAKAMEEAQTPQALRGPVLATYEKLLAAFPALSPDAYLEDGLELESWLGPLRVLHTPGHAPGHCCLWAAQFGYLFSGDHVIEEISPHIGWLPGEDALGSYLDSLDRLDALEVEKILPSHGVPFESLREWTARAREHHAGRAAEILRLQQDGADCVDDIIRRLWPRELRPLDYKLALTEVLAHLEHIRRRVRT